ncbi:MAG: phage tail tape measure protein, partial [Bacteroidia bacterium]
MQSKWNKGIGKMRMKFATLTKEVPLLGRALDMLQNPLILATAGVLALGSVAIKGVSSAERFDHAFTNIRNLNLDKSKDQLDTFRAKIRDASYEIGANLEKSTNAVYDLQSATGLYGDNAISVYKKVGRYSIATGADINEAMNSTTKAMKAFNLGVNDIDTLLESNAKTVQTGITTFDQLARVQTEYAGAAASASQGIDQA